MIMAKKDLATFGLKDKFDYSKPVELIKRLIKNHYNKNAIVLDFLQEVELQLKPY